MSKINFISNRNTKIQFLVISLFYSLLYFLFSIFKILFIVIDLLTLSSHSFSGILSLVMPQPIYKIALFSWICMLRKFTNKSELTDLLAKLLFNSPRKPV